MLIICCLDQVRAVVAERRPARVISLLSEEDALPDLPGLDETAHLKLYVDEESCARTIDAAARVRAAQIIEFVRAWKCGGDVVIHCSRGVSRSTAAAFIVLCMCAPETPETAVMNELRAAAPHADPCPLLIAYADEILHRDGRMIDAVEELGPPCPVLRAPLVQLQTAA